MKKLILNSFQSAILATLMAGAGIATTQAQTTTVTTSSTTTSAGTVSEFTPDVITVQNASAAPVTYSYTKTTTYVDQNGNPVSMDVVKSGVPVTVYYTTDGSKMVASKVVVRTVTTDSPAPVVEQKKTTTTTTSTTAPNP